MWVACNERMLWVWLTERMQPQESSKKEYHDAGTASSKRFGLDRVTQAALGIGMVASLAVGTWIATTVDNDAAIRTHGAGNQAMTAGNPLFLEMNILSEITVAELPSLADYRFAELNMTLPGDGVNALVQSLSDHRFLELNVHLGSDAQTGLPSGERGERY